MKKILSLLFLVLVSVPAVSVLAASPKDFKGVVNLIIEGILQPLVPFLIGLAVVVFIYGVLLLMLSEGGEKKEEGKQYMLWGIIGIFVMVSVWGLVAIVSNTFKLDTNQNKQIEMNVPDIQVTPLKSN